MKKIIVVLLFFSVGLGIKAEGKYSGNFSFGVGTGYNLSLCTSHGKLVTPKLFVGLGTGVSIPLFSPEIVDTKGNVLICPVFADIWYIPFKSRVSPIITTRLGGENMFISQWKTGDYENTLKKSYKLTGFISPSLGVRIRLFKSFAFYTKFSGHFRTVAIRNAEKLGYSYSLGIVF